MTAELDKARRKKGVGFTEQEVLRSQEVYEAEKWNSNYRNIIDDRT